MERYWIIQGVITITMTIIIHIFITEKPAPREYNSAWEVYKTVYKNNAIK